MSASEKLKGLDAATPLEKYEIDLFGVLPQLLAVVEAAEKNERDPYGLSPVESTELARALTALEEALT